MTSWWPDPPPSGAWKRKSWYVRGHTAGPEEPGPEGRPVPRTPPKGSLMGGPGENRPSQSWVASDLAAKTRTQAPSCCRLNTRVPWGLRSWEPKDARWLRIPRAQAKSPRGHGCRVLGLSANLFQGLGQTCHTELLPLKRTSDTHILCTPGKFKTQ